jgi:hypothetical protein
MEQPEKPRSNPFRSNAFNLTKQLETEASLASSLSTTRFVVEKVVIDD